VYAAVTMVLDPCSRARELRLLEPVPRKSWMSSLPSANPETRVKVYNAGTKADPRHA
jgi:hypothetical protein